MMRSAKALDVPGTDLIAASISRASFSIDMAARRPSIDVVNKMFKSRSGRDLNDNSSRQLMAMIVLADAIDRAKSTDGPKIRDSLAATNIPGEQTIMPWSKCAFGPDGQNMNADPVLIQYRDKNWVTVFPSSVATTKAVWPMNA